MAAPYGGGVFPPPVNGVAGVVGAAGAAGEVKAPPPVTVKEDNSGAGQQAPPSGAQVPAATSAGPHPSAAGAQTAASFSPPPPPNGVDQQIVSIPFFALSEKNHRGHSNDFLPRSSRRVAFGRVPRTNNDFSSVRGAWGRVFLRRTFIESKGYLVSIRDVLVIFVRIIPRTYAPRPRAMGARPRFRGFHLVVPKETRLSSESLRNDKSARSLRQWSL